MDDEAFFLVQFDIVVSGKKRLENVDRSDGKLNRLTVFFDLFR